jgi:hypothetical protein
VSGNRESQSKPDIHDADIERQLIEDMAALSNDPLGYVAYAYPWGVPGTELEHYTGPRAWQRAVLSDIGARLRAGAADTGEVIREAVASGHGVGKGALIAWIADWAVKTLEDTKVVITANTERQLFTKTSPELAKWHRLSNNRHWFKFTTTALYSTDPLHEKTWRVDLIAWSEHNTEAFAGLHNEGKRIVLLFDEASAIADRVWEVAEGALTDARTEIIWAAFGNPTRNTGRFRECFRKFRHRWNGLHVDSRTVDGTNKEQLGQWVEDYGDDSDFVKIRVRGMFPSASAKQFISEADVDAAYGRGLKEQAFEWAPKILSVEPSWEGDDEFVIGLRQGLSFRVLATYAKNDNDVQVANIIMRFEDEEKADVVFCDAGYGTGIVSVARTVGRDWILVWFAEKSADLGCLNKRAEMWKLMRDWLKEGGAIPKDPVLHDELIAPETVARLDGKLQLESKKDMKTRGVPSPNRADCLAITFAHPVMPKRGIHSQGTAKVSFDWDPLEERRGGVLT